MTPQRPGRLWRISIAAAVGIAAGMALGGWQLSRAAQKNAMHAQVQERSSLSALDGAALAAVTTPADHTWRPVLLQGRWVAEHTVFLDNRQMQGKPGFDVLTPLRLAGTDAAVVVQRGWVRRDFVDRTRLPAVETPAGAVQVRGLIAPPPAKLYALGAEQAGAIRQNLELAEFRARTGLPLLTGLSVRQAGPASEGLLREWTQPGSGVEKHYGYAFQWFALSALIAILYVWFLFIAPRRKPPHA